MSGTGPERATRSVDASAWSPPLPEAPGFDHLVVHGPGHDQERFLSTFCEQVLPGLRELTPALR